MNERLHEIIVEISQIHKEILKQGLQSSVAQVEAFIKKRDADIKEHYLNLLMQYYFQNNDLKNLKELLLKGCRFSLRFNDIKEAFLHTQDEGSVITFLDDNVVHLKDSVEAKDLQVMHKYFLEQDQEIQTYLLPSIELIRKNRMVCILTAHYQHEPWAVFFFHKELYESIERDTPHLLK